ncbi:hypothetical protein ACLMJK_001352 [Lecanora helva]
MGKDTSTAPNGFIRTMKKLYHPLGFKKGYNFYLWFIFAGALFGFSLSRFMYLNYDVHYREGSAPGEWYWQHAGLRRVGLILHLATILPAGLLVVLQFTPIIRYKALLFHRLNGYFVVLLLLLSEAGALMLAKHSFGGEFETQTWTGFLVIITTVSVILAYYNIKRLQIEQHRAWMLRTWFYAASIITLRIVMIISAQIVGPAGGFYQAVRCDKIKFLYADRAIPGVEQDYPQCFSSAPNATIDGYTVVPATFSGNSMQIGSALGVTFGTAGWLATTLHAIGVEIYLHLTPRETERLRKLSYERQLERGMRNPGDAGLTAQRLGDTDAWHPIEEESVGKGTQADVVG